MRKSPARVAMEQLKLIALDEEDLSVVSSLLQDAVLRVADMTYVPAQKRFAAVLNRFDWEKAVTDGGKDYSPAPGGAPIRPRVQRPAQECEAGSQTIGYCRCWRSASSRLSRRRAMSRSTFSGDASIQLKVECIEAELRDLGPAWRTHFKPLHPGDEPGAGSEPGAGKS